MNFRQEEKDWGVPGWDVDGAKEALDDCQPSPSGRSWAVWGARLERFTGLPASFARAQRAESEWGCWDGRLTRALWGAGVTVERAVRLLDLYHRLTPRPGGVESPYQPGILDVRALDALERMGVIRPRDWRGWGRRPWTSAAGWAAAEYAAGRISATGLRDLLRLLPRLRLAHKPVGWWLDEPEAVSGLESLLRAPKAGRSLHALARVSGACARAVVAFLGQQGRGEHGYPAVLAGIRRFEDLDHRRVLQWLRVPARHWLVGYDQDDRLPRGVESHVDRRRRDVGLLDQEGGLRERATAMVERIGRLWPAVDFAAAAAAADAAWGAAQASPHEGAYVEARRLYVQADEARYRANRLVGSAREAYRRALNEVIAGTHRACESTSETEAVARLEAAARERLRDVVSERVVAMGGPRLQWLRPVPPIPAGSRPGWDWLAEDSRVLPPLPDRPVASTREEGWYE
jgi:hypothetical protein